MDKVNESVWTDMQKRSVGDDERLEDGLNRDGLFDYIKEHYEGFDDDQFDNFPFKSEGNKTNEWIQIPLFSIKEYGTRYSLIVKFENDKIVKIALDTNEEKCSEFIDILKEKFEVTISESGSPILITNKSTVGCLDILDTIIENVKFPKIKKKEE